MVTEKKVNVASKQLSAGGSDFLLLPAPPSYTKPPFGGTRASSRIAKRRWGSGRDREKRVSYQLELKYTLD